MLNKCYRKNENKFLQKKMKVITVESSCITTHAK